MAEVGGLILSNLQYVKMILPFVVLNILLPTIDIISDIYMVAKLHFGVYECQWSSMEELDAFWSCKSDSYTFCSNATIANDNICRSITHEIYATVLFLPFFAAYLVCFYSWSQSEREKSKTFLFPLLGMYPQMGKCEFWFIKVKSDYNLFQRHLQSSKLCTKIWRKV